MTSTNRYDAFDGRVRATSTGPAPFSSKDQYVFYDGEDVTLTTGPSQENAVYLHGLAVDEVLARENMGGPIAEWVFSDHLGSVRDVM